MQPMHVGNAGTETRMGMHEPHEVFARLVPTIRCHQQSAGLVECHEGVVFKHDGRQRHGGPFRTNHPAIRKGTSDSRGDRAWVPRQGRKYTCDGWHPSVTSIRPMPVWPKFFYTFGVNMKTA